MVGRLVCLVDTSRRGTGLESLQGVGVSFSRAGSAILRDEEDGKNDGEDCNA